ncbi:MAG: electron transfer flavoprotein subunit beta/FixA family protein [Acidobacteriaceae bacterium]
MRILAIIRQVLDAEESVYVDHRAIDLKGRKLVMDTMDEYGVEEALRIRERGAEAEIVVVGIGPERLQEALRSALAMGADRAIHVETNEEVDPIALSGVVAAIARKEEAQMIFCGGQQADWDSQVLGAAVAEHLDWPAVTWTRKLELKGSTLAGQRDAEDGVESFEVDLPAVVTTQQDLNEPRYPTLPNVMKAKRKEIRLETLESFGVGLKVRSHGVEAQSRERLREVIDGRDAAAAAAQLLTMLREKAGVMA